jgi:hypothetical protein
VTYVCGASWKDKVHVNNPHSLRELEENTWQKFQLFQGKLCHMSKILFCFKMWDSHTSRMLSFQNSTLNYGRSYCRGNAGSEYLASHSLLHGKLAITLYKACIHDELQTLYINITYQNLRKEKKKAEAYFNAALLQMLTNSTKQSYSWDLTVHSASQEIPYLHETWTCHLSLLWARWILHEHKKGLQQMRPF